MNLLTQRSCKWSVVYINIMAEGGGGRGRGVRERARELYRHYVTASSRAVASGRGPGLLVHGELYNHCLLWKVHRGHGGRGG